MFVYRFRVRAVRADVRVRDLRCEQLRAGDGRRAVRARGARRARRAPAAARPRGALQPALRRADQQAVPRHAHALRVNPTLP